MVSRTHAGNLFVIKSLQLTLTQSFFNYKIVGITNPKGEKRYLAAAFPSQCGKTNMAMMTPSLPGYKVECVGDGIIFLFD